MHGATALSAPSPFCTALHLANTPHGVKRGLHFFMLQKIILISFISRHNHQQLLLVVCDLPLSVVCHCFLNAYDAITILKNHAKWSTVNPPVMEQTSICGNCDAAVQWRSKGGAEGWFASGSMFSFFKMSNTFYLTFFEDGQYFVMWGRRRATHSQPAPCIRSFSYATASVVTCTTPYIFNSAGYCFRQLQEAESHFTDIDRTF